jgi:ABC-type transport system involved in multi-copper enzyme maturation permease subunit
MNTLRVLYHLARADFLERIRRYSFLIILGLVLFLGYAIASGQLVLEIGGKYRGVINSAWVGGLMTTYTGFVLGLFGFYLIKGSIHRDYETGVGQIMATTPLKRPLYTLGKWLSNFAVLGIMVVILAVVGVVMQLVYREDPVLDWWALLSPFLLLGLPYMAFTAALAVLFETIRWLRGGLGNVIYFFLYMLVIIMLSFSIYGTPPNMDIVGMGFLERSMDQAVKAAYPDAIGSFMMSPFSAERQTFHWDGIAWTSDIVISRLVLFLVSIGLAALAAIFFDRFNPSRLLRARRKKAAPDHIEPAAALEAPSAAAVAESGRVVAAHLTPLTGTRVRSQFGGLFIAELKLLLKGQRWWWYVIAAGLIVAQFFTPLEYTRLMLVVGWVWPVLLLSGLGCRENRYDTRQIVFAAPHPIASQLPAAWLAAFVVTAVMGSGALVKFTLAGETLSLLGWLTGAVFIPSLALALGTLTGSSKAFEVLYVLCTYMILQKIPLFDFAGLIPNSRWYIYAPLALVLLAVAALARQWQLTGKGRRGR